MFSRYVLFFQDYFYHLKRPKPKCCGFLPALPVRVGQLSERSFGWGDPRNATSFPQLDPTGLHFRDEADRHFDLQVPVGSDVPQRHPQVPDRDRGSHSPTLRQHVRHALYTGKSFKNE